MQEQVTSPTWPRCILLTRASLTAKVGVIQWLLSRRQARPSFVAGTRTNSHRTFAYSEDQHGPVHRKQHLRVQHRTITTSTSGTCTSTTSTSTGYNIQQISAEAIGDPHIKTLDGRSYTLLSQGTFLLWHLLPWRQSCHSLGENQKSKEPQWNGKFTHIIPAASVFYQRLVARGHIWWIPQNAGNYLTEM